MSGFRFLKFVQTLAILAVMLFCYGYSQFADTFTDGDFTSAPTWSGDGSLFVVNASNQLQSNGLAITDTIYLTTPNAKIDSAEWNFWVRLDFQPSTTNLLRIYLVSDQANIQGPLNGYFLQIGETGTTDSIDVFRQNGLTVTKLATGNKGCISSATSNVLRIRVRRDNLGNWTVDSDCAGGTAWTPECSFFDNTFTSTSFFGVSCRHTSTRFDKFFFDDFYCGSWFVDNIPPTPLTATPLSATLLDIDFDEPVDNIAATTLSNYMVSGGIGNPSSAIRDLSDSSIVHLTFGTAFTSGTPYTITISSISDTAGNSMPLPVGLPFTWTASVTPLPGDVVINEIMADPSPVVGLPNFEFIEIYNTTSSSFNTAGWKISDGATTGSLLSRTLGPGQYAILCPIADTALFTSFGQVIGVTSFPSLNNSGDNLGLRTGTGVRFDSVMYLLSWYKDGIKDDGGWSLERINPLDTCGGIANWSASMDPAGGTPGIVNSIYSAVPDVTAPQLVSLTITGANTLQVCFDESPALPGATTLTNYTLSPTIGNPVSAITSGSECVDLTFAVPFDSSLQYFLTISGIADCKGNTIITAVDSFRIGNIPQPGDLLITELFPDPSPVVGLPGSEFVEIFNTTAGYINLGGCVLTDGGSSATLGSYVMTPGEYLILCPLADTAAYGAFGNVLGLSSMPSLNNTGDSIWMSNGGSTLLDRVDYTDDWYQNAVKQDGGWTLERIDLTFPCQSSGNWIASVNPTGGTPGNVNSVNGTFTDTVAPELISAIFLTTTQIQVTFSEPVEFADLSNASFYLITPVMGVPVSVSGISGGNTIAILTFVTPADTGVLYTITASNMRDCAGNGSGSASNTTAIMAAPPQTGDLIITELFPDPSPVVGLPDGEFIEVYNASPDYLDLTGCYISDGSASSGLSFTILPPGGYLILCPTADTADYGIFGPYRGVGSFPSLNNAGDSVMLYSAADVLIDRVDYTDDWYQDESKKDGGWTLERVDLFFPCQSSGNWRASTDGAGGTPGLLNSVNGTYVDTVAPSITGARFINPYQIEVTFSEVVDIADLTNPARYFVSPGVAAPIAVVGTSGGGTTALLLFTTPADTGTLYRIRASGIRDCIGNGISDSSFAYLIIALPPQIGDLGINEILFNPATGGADYVEVVNTGTGIIDLSMLYLAKRDETTGLMESFSNVIDHPVLLYPGAYACFTEDVGFQLSQYFPINPGTIYESNDLPTWDDNEGTVLLMRFDSLVLDSVAYLDDWHYPDLDTKDGVSLERLSFSLPSQNPESWHSAAANVHYGTPGYQNSQQFEPDGDDEIQVEPEVFSPDQDGRDDQVFFIFNLKNPGNNVRINIFDAQGHKVRFLLPNTLVGTETTIFAWDGLMDNLERAPMGIYVVVIEISRPADGSFRTIKRTCVLGRGQ